MLTRHDAVAEAAVIGRADPEWGETVVAYVVPATGKTIDSATLDAFCIDRIARFKRPRHYRMVDGLPKNDYGKVMRKKLRESDRDGEA